MATKPSIAIIGNGWAGFTLAHALSTSKYSITVISPIRTVQYTPLLASAAAGMFNFRLAEEPVLRRDRRPALNYYKAHATNVDFARKIVHCQPAVTELAGAQQHDFEVQYDKLVLAPGCNVQTFGTPGALEHAQFLRTTDDARRVQQRLLEMLDSASMPGLSEKQQRDILTIRIVGGGPIGIEATAELSDLWQEEVRHVYPHLDGKLQICVHDVAPTVLGTFDARLGEYAIDRLKGRGIKILTESHIEHVEKDAIWTKEDGELKYGMLLWATGNGNNPLVESLNVRKQGKLQRIMTDRRLRVYDEKDEVLDGVYAMGDSADIEGYGLPMLAEAAVQKAEYLARELNASGVPQNPFEYRQKANLAYLGQRDGVIGGQKEWTGQSAWIAWRSGSIFHWPRSWRRTVMIGISWLFNSIGGRDIARKW